MYVAALQFSGSQGEKNLQENMVQLENYVTDNGLQTNGKPFYAFYDPPWTPPFLRRNEIIIMINKPL